MTAAYIVIFEADKGGAVVVMNKSDYINEAIKHLNSVDADGNRIYKELSYDCTDKFVRDVGEAINKAAVNKVIDEELADLLFIDSPKPGNIYFLPKIHSEIRPPAGRPICNTINTPTMNLSKWVDIQLQPLVKGELQRENKLISYERAFKMLENDMYIAGIGQAVLELLSFKVESGNHQRGISFLQKISDIFGNMRLVPLKTTSHLTSHNFKNIKN